MPPFADVLQWEHLPFPKSLRDFQRLFPDDDACARYLEGAKWPKGFTCPHCQEKGEPVRLATRPGVLACRACRKQTSLTVDTVMQRTHTPQRGFVPGKAKLALKLHCRHSLHEQFEAELTALRGKP